ncbi:MAG: hypothetical protein ISS27_03075 [Candidatus Omnitrophica bacterium]|nr:hypothetical protein [Candidatus Omnitrophota bacterium]
MRFEEFIRKVENLPVIDTESLLVGSSDLVKVKVQISRWAKSGKLIQLKRGMYVLSPVYRKVEPYGPFIAATLKQPSYLSLEKALEFHGLIPEGVKVYTSLATKWQDTFKSKVGVFSYQHIRKELFWGYVSVSLKGQTGFIASPEKALLDFFYVKKIRATFEYLQEMRLQNLDKLNPEKLLSCAKRFNKPGMLRAAKLIAEFIEKEKGGEKSL